MAKQVEIPKPGVVGFYGPDPGSSKSPNFVLAADGDQLSVFELPSRMIFTIDAADWMSLDQMEESTLAILNAPHDDLTVRKLDGRIRALTEAHRLFAWRIAAVVDVDKRMTAREEVPTGDDYNLVFTLLAADPVSAGAYPA